MARGPVHLPARTSTAVAGVRLRVRGPGWFVFSSCFDGAVTPRVSTLLIPAPAPVPVLASADRRLHLTGEDRTANYAAVRSRPGRYAL